MEVIIDDDASSSVVEVDSGSSGAARAQFENLRGGVAENQAAQGTRWCFTLNNYQEAHLSIIEMVLAPLAKWLIYGKETAPNTGTKHLQGFVMLQKNKRLAGMKSILVTAHWELARGSNKQNFEYCSKDGDFVEFGVRPEFHENNGKREKSDWEKVWSSAKQGKIDEIPAHARVTCYSSIKMIGKDYMQPMPDADDVTGVWIQGPSGIGKSRRARNDYPGAYFKLCNKWWDGYQGEDFVIMDDLSQEHACLAYHIKIWGDRYSFVAESKGSAACIRPKKFVITSQYKINEIFTKAEDREAIARRFHVVDLFPPALFPIFRTPEPHLRPVTPGPDSVPGASPESRVGGTDQLVDEGTSKKQKRVEWKSEPDVDEDVIPCTQPMAEEL